MKDTKHVYTSEITLLFHRLVDTAEARISKLCASGDSMGMAERRMNAAAWRYLADRMKILADDVSEELLEREKRI